MVIDLVIMTALFGIVVSRWCCEPKFSCGCRRRTVPGVSMKTQIYGADVECKILTSSCSSNQCQCTSDCECCVYNSSIQGHKTHGRNHGHCGECNGPWDRDCCDMARETSISEVIWIRSDVGCNCITKNETINGCYVEKKTCFYVKSWNYRPPPPCTQHYELYYSTLITDDYGYKGYSSGKTGAIDSYSMALINLKNQNKSCIVIQSPTMSPTTLTPTDDPTSAPTLNPSSSPTFNPSSFPTFNPTNQTSLPTHNPTLEPTLEPIIITLFVDFIHDEENYDHYNYIAISIVIIIIILFIIIFIFICCIKRKNKKSHKEAENQINQIEMNVSMANVNDETLSLMDDSDDNMIEHNVEPSAHSEQKMDESMVHGVHSILDTAGNMEHIPLKSADLENKEDEYKNNNNNIVQEPKCVVCMDAIREYACSPCGHWCLCRNCKDEINGKCPICQYKCSAVMKIHQ